MKKILLILFMIQSILYANYERVVVTYRNSMNNNMTKNIENKYDSLEFLKNELLKNNYISDCNININEKKVIIEIEYIENNFYDMKSSINSIVKKYNLDLNYMYTININSKYYGYYSGMKGDYIVWIDD